MRQLVSNMKLIITAIQGVFDIIAYATIGVMLFSLIWVLYGGEIYIQLTKDLPVTHTEIHK